MFFCHSWFDTHSLIEFSFGLYFRPNRIDMQLILNKFDDALNWILFGPFKLTYYLFGHKFVDSQWRLNRRYQFKTLNNIESTYFLQSLKLYLLFLPLMNHHNSFTIDLGFPISAFFNNSRKLRNVLGTISPGSWMQGSLCVSLTQTLVALYMFLSILIYKWFQW